MKTTPKYMIAALGSALAFGGQPAAAQDAKEKKETPKAYQLRPADGRLYLVDPSKSLTARVLPEKEAMLLKRIQELKAASAANLQKMEAELALLREARKRAAAPQAATPRAFVRRPDGATGPVSRERWMLGVQLTGENDGGLKVHSAIKGSSAEKAGIREGDVIAAVNGIRIDGYDALQAIVNAAKGQELTMTIKRGGKDMKVKVTPKKVGQTARVTPLRYLDLEKGWKPLPNRVEVKKNPEIEGLRNEVKELRKLVEKALKERD